MPRWTVYDVPVDTGMFTPVGLQPAYLFRLAFSGAGRWLSQHAVSHRRLVSESNTGFVIWSAGLTSVQPVSFFDADCLQIRVSGRVTGGGSQFACDGDVVGPFGPVARLHACCVPLRLDGDPALSGVPARLTPEVLAALLPDEIESVPVRSPVPGLRAALAREGTLLAQQNSRFTIHRHQCEVADQWFWPEAASIAADGREDLIRSNDSSGPELNSGLATQPDRLDLLFSRPFFLFDEGLLISSAYEWQGQLVFLHDLVGREDEQPRAVVIEQFGARDRAWD